ncbi:Asp-tRNA(Asn)/Glu-tRNA(Gln) amidotransferase subunit GatA [Patescibacteria group bacterium]|nr:Asp-tRNA(Asn)/Glu-tRNA(Gln) amidotransferase subunit GatA [Patescibacteria group bacterium]
MSGLNKFSLAESRELLKKGEISSEDLVRACLEQIEVYDPKIKAFVTVLEDKALRQAKRADNLIKKRGKEVFDEKPLLGIPYAAKDNFSTRGVLTTSSSNMLDNYIPPFDATVIKRLNEAGAILIGKTNMDAFAHGASTEASDFFTTKNPWDTDKVAGGSSGGSAAAVGSDMCVFAVGSETGGSIRGPASWCGVVGFKPSYGRVSRYGVTAMASSTDSPGPITKTVKDAAIVLGIIAGKDPFDATTSPVQVPNYLSGSEEIDVKGLKIGKPRSYFEVGLDEPIRKCVESGLKELGKQGAEIVDVDLLDPKYSISVYTILQRSEVSSNLGRLDGIRYGNTRDHFGKEAKKRIMLGTYTLSSGYYDEYYGKAQKVRTLIIDDFNKVLERVNFICGPTMPCTAMDIGAIDTSPLFGELIDLLNEPSSIAGLPGVTIPCGYVKDLPVGIQFIGRMMGEKTILNVSHRFQQVTNYHKERPNL